MSPPPTAVEWAAAHRGAWRHRALCKGVGVRPFYPPDKDDPDEPQVDGATLAMQAAYIKALCATCTVRRLCLIDSIATRDIHYGYRAGCGARARMQLRRQWHTSAKAA
jgi:hypothetical protein